MKDILRLLCLSLCLLCFTPARAQSDTLVVHNLIIKFSPQHLFTNELHFDLERSIHPEGKHALIISPSFFYGSTAFIDETYNRDDELDENNRMKGYGLGLLHRIYTSEEGLYEKQQGFYIAYGIEYSHFQLNFERYGYRVETNQQGLEVYKYRQRPFREKIDRLGVMGMGGLQGPFIFNRVIADISMGIGYRESYSKTNYTQRLFNEGFLDYGYTGIYLLAVMKFGYLL